MIRWTVFALLAMGAVAYSYWFYLRVELPRPSSVWLALARSTSLVVLLLLLFDPELPSSTAAGSPDRWVLVDASLSMEASGGGDSSWDAAGRRAQELESDGWRIAYFGNSLVTGDPGRPAEVRTLLAPTLERAAEAGVREVVVLSDGRFEDAVAAISALELLPLTASFERVGQGVVNAGISDLDVPDAVRSEGTVSAEIEVHGGSGGDSLTVEIREEERVAATVRVPAPVSGLRLRVPVELPAPSSASRRVRYSASIRVPGDAFPSDDEAVSYASVGQEEGALVLVSFRPDWEPRYLLPVLEDVTGLPVRGYLRVGEDRFIPMGRALERGEAVDSVAVRRAATGAAMLVFSGVGAELDPWGQALVRRPGRRVLFATDPEGTALAGTRTGSPRPGEWYVSGDLPPSPIAGALAGIDFQRLPPLADVLLPRETQASASPLKVQLRGTGVPVDPLRLLEAAGGRTALVLASGFWRWAARPDGQRAYRGFWSGISGWLLEDTGSVASEIRPRDWVVQGGDPVEWIAPPGSAGARLTVSQDGIVVLETSVESEGAFATDLSADGLFSYVAMGSEGDTLGAGRFDITLNTVEMAWPALLLDVPEALPGLAGSPRAAGTPLRTRPWPYLIVILLLCAEWVGRRRSGLR